MREKKATKKAAKGLNSEDLSVVKNAGFVASKKDKSENRRAGLHDKKKELEGESRIYRRKPLALKHVRRMRKAAVAFSAVIVAAVSVVGVGFLIQPAVPPLDNTYYKTVCYTTPDDSSLPTDHTLVENVGYMNYVLQNQPFWSSEMDLTVHTIMEQRVKTYKQFYEDVLISADISRGASTSATQFCVAGDVVLWRSAASDNYDGMNTEWYTGPASGLKVEDYRTLRGYPPSEFSVYVLNENTIKNAYDKTVTDNGNGTYSITLDLNVDVLDGETSAVHYYKQQMRVTGGLSDYPDYDYAQVTYTFDGSWRVLEYSITDKYSAKMGMVSAPCASETYGVYSYAEEDAVNSFYNDYFAKYKDSYEPGSVDAKPDATVCLSTAFGSVLTDGGIFNVDLTVSELNLRGTAFVEMKDGSLGDIRAKFSGLMGGISAYYGDDMLYLSVGDNAKLKLALGDLLSVNSLTEGESALNTEELLQQLMGGNFELSEDETKATLNSSLNLFGLDISLTFAFNINGADITLDFVSANIPLGNTSLSAHMTFGTEEDIPQALTESQKEKYIDVANGFNFSGLAELSADGTQIALDISDLSVNFEDGFAFGLNAKLTVNGTYMDINASYGKNFEGDNILNISYGGVGVSLNLNSGIATVKHAFNAVINRISVVADYVTGTVNVPEIDAQKALGFADDIIELLKELKVDEAVLGGISEIITTVENIISGNASEGFDIVTLLNSVAVSSRGGNITVELGNANTVLSAGNFTLSPYSQITMEEDNLLSADDLADMLDYLAVAAEIITQQQFAVEVNAYTQTLDISVAIEYDRGENGLPLHLDLGTLNQETGLMENGNFWIDSTAYLHLSLGLDYKDVAVDDIYLDAYIFDANDDRVFDAAVKVSKFTNEAAAKAAGVTYNPLQLYMPVDDVLSIVSMAGAMANLGDINFGEDKVMLNKIAAQVALAVDSLLVTPYLGADSTKYSSLGASLIKQVLDGMGMEADTIGELLNGLLLGTEADGSEEPEEEPATQKCGNYISGLSVKTGESLSLTLNSAAIYGAEFDDIAFTVSKNNSLLTGLSLKNIYYGEDNENRLDLDASFGYSFTKLTASDFTKYDNYSDLDTLLKTAVNSATHYDEADKAYALNDNFLMKGSVEISILGYKIPVDINAFSVQIDTKGDNSVTINLSAHYNKVLIAINEGATIDVSVSMREGMIYLRRLLDGASEYTYRAMTLEEFAGDNLMDNIGYMFNLSSTIMNLINGGDSNSDETETTAISYDDYGNYLDNYVTSYQYLNNAWRVVINGSKLGELIGISMDNVTVDLNTFEKDGEVLLDNLKVSGSMKYYVTVKFSAEITYCNPQGVERTDIGAVEKPVDLALVWENMTSGNSGIAVTESNIYNQLKALSSTAYVGLVTDGNAIYFETASAASSKISYQFLGWWYRENGIYKRIEFNNNDFSQLEKAVESGYAVEPVWMMVSLSGGASKSSSGSIVNRSYSYTINDVSVSYGFIGDSQIVSGLIVDEVTLYGYVAGSYVIGIVASSGTDFSEYKNEDTFKKYQGALNFVNENGLNTVSGIALDNISTKSNCPGWNVAVGFKVVYGGGVFVVGANNGTHICGSFN